MSWLFFSLASYFFLALAGIFDRLVLIGSPVSSKLYAFYVASLSAVIGLVLLPLINFFIPPYQTLFISLAAGIIWVVFLWALYESVFRAGISRTAPVIGGFGPIFTFLIGFLFLGQEALLSPFGFIAFILFIGAGVLLSRTEKGTALLQGGGFSIRVLTLLAGTAFLFGLYLVVLKMVFAEQSFLEGFVWMRLGAAMCALFFLASRQVRAAAFRKEAVAQKQFLLPFLGAQIFGGLGVFLQQLSVFFARAREVAFVPALIGIQYIFLYLLMAGLYRWRPQLLKEAMAGRALREKIIGAALVIIGLVMLAFA